MGHAKRWPKSAYLAKFHYQFLIVFLVCVSLSRDSSVWDLSKCLRQHPRVALSWIVGKNDSFNQFLRPRWKQRREFDKNSLVATVLKYISRTIISNTTAVLYLNVVLRSLNMIQKADHLILAILSETTAKVIVQKNICEQLMSFYKFLSWIPSMKSNAALQHHIGILIINPYSTNVSWLMGMLPIDWNLQQEQSSFSYIFFQESFYSLGSTAKYLF